MESAVELKDVVKQFGSLRAVDRVTLSIPKGSIYGLIGPNGAGKTTTFSIIAGFLRATDGSARVLGHAPHEVRSLKGRVGVLPQDALLPPRDRVGDFLVYLARLQGMTAREADTEAHQSLDSVGGSEWWKLRCGALSHGMAKRVGVAQAILGKPELVLLDEPTAGLDPKVAYQLRQFIKGLGQRCTTIVSSHNLQELEEVCTGAAILDRGRLVSAGTMSALTGASEEIRVQVAPGTDLRQPPAAHRDQKPTLETLRAIADVTRAEFDSNQSVLVIAIDPTKCDAETMIGRVLRVLLDAEVRISGVAKGRRLEQKVMELT